VLAELEIWPNLIRIASRFPIGNSPDNEVKLAVMNGRLSESSLYGYRRFGWLLRSSFRKLDWVAAQNRTYAERFVQVGCDEQKVAITGSVKFDGVETDRNNEASRRLAELVGVESEQIVFVAGSTQLEEDLMAARVHQELQAEYPQLRLILAPRHPDRVPKLLKSLTETGWKTQLRSELPQSSLAAPPNDRNPVFNCSSEAADAPPILIIDLIGELAAWWGVADLAYVGGSLGSRGGQNMIEPAAYGIAVSFGPNTQNFRDVVEQLLSVHGATVIHDQHDLKNFVTRVLTDEPWVRETGRNAQVEVLRHQGAADRTVAGLLSLVGSSTDGQ